MQNLSGIGKMNIDPFPLSVIEQQPRAGAPAASAGGQGRATGAHLPSAPFAGGLGGFSPVWGGALSTWGVLVPRVNFALEILLKLDQRIRSVAHVLCYRCTRYYMLCSSQQ